MFFKKKNKEATIVTKVTKTGTQANFEIELREKAREQNRVCPECGHKNEPKMLGFSSGDGGHGYYGKCKKCNAEWRTEY